MWRGLSISLFLLLPVMAIAQAGVPYGKTRAEYERVIKKVIRYYNNQQPDSMYSVISDKWEDKKKEFPFSIDILRLDQKQYGKIVSYKYIGTNSAYYDELLNPMVFFKIIYSKPSDNRKSSKAHAMCISLDEEGKIYGWNFITSSPYIDSMIVRY